jgi:hypothetical protein
VAGAGGVWLKQVSCAWSSRRVADGEGVWLEQEASRCG